MVESPFYSWMRAQMPSLLQNLEGPNTQNLFGKVSEALGTVARRREAAVALQQLQRHVQHLRKALTARYGASWETAFPGTEHEMKDFEYAAGQLDCYYTNRRSDIPNDNAASVFYRALMSSFEKLKETAEKIDSH